MDQLLILLVGLSQLGNEVGFIGKISDDELGAKYEDGLEKRKSKSIFTKRKKKKFQLVLV